MYKKDHVVHLLQKIKQTLERIIANSKEIDSYQYYYLTPAGMERLESTCMLLIAVGESIKGIDKVTILFSATTILSTVFQPIK